MKRIVLAVIAVAGLTAGVNAQSADRTSGIVAYKAYEKNPLDPSSAKKLAEAKEYLDKAYNAGFQEDPRTNFFRGKTYMGLLGQIAAKYQTKGQKTNSCIAPEGAPVMSDDDRKLSTEYLNTMTSSLKTAYDKRTKKDDDSEEITLIATMGRIQSVTCGNENYNAKNYERAAALYGKAIEMLNIIGQLDTMATYNRGLCYERLQKYSEAMADFVKCASVGYGNADVYRLIFETAAASGKVEEGGKYLKEGRAKYPKDQSLVFSEVNYYLGQGKNVEAEKAINEALSLDPKNPTLYFALGNTYDNLANPRDEKGKDLPKPANFAELSKKGEEAYKKAIEIKPDYFDALFNIGVLKYNEGAEQMNRIKDIADNAQYDKEKAKADEKFAAALPYLEKAREVNPKDRDNLRMLKVVYVRTGNAEKAAEVQKELDNK